MAFLCLTSNLEVYSSWKFSVPRNLSVFVHGVVLGHAGSRAVGGKGSIEADRERKR
jgi:hypothetical protein